MRLFKYYKSFIDRKVVLFCLLFLFFLPLGIVFPISQAEAITNLVNNDSFESGQSFWQFNLRSGVTGSFTTTTQTSTDGNTSGRVITNNSSAYPWHAELAQYGLSITSGQTYTVRFWAKASANRPIDSVIQRASFPYTVYVRRTHNLTTNWQQFTYTFQPSSSQSNAFIGLQVGKNAGTVWFDKIEVFAGTAPTPTPTVLPTATPTAAPTATPTPTSSPNAILYGKTGTFGNLGTSLPTGQSLQTKPVTDWGFNAGQSEFFSALASNGEIVLGTNPQTDNQVYATADHMSIGVFNPTTNIFRNIVIPTSTGEQSVTNPFYQVGGASVETLLPVSVGGQSRIAFISSVPYHGWDIMQNGEYPSLGYLDVIGGNLSYNASFSKSANQICAYGGSSASACPQNMNIFGQQVANCRGFAEMDLLPLSQKYVVTQYFPDVYAGQQSGRIVVMNTDGSIAASYIYPNIPNGSGGYYSINPREVVADPTSNGDLEYFSVIFDVMNEGTQLNFPLQEFAYNRSTNQIIPISTPFLSGQTNGSGIAYRFETARYDSLGNLWATQAVPNSLAGGPIVVYVKGGGNRKLETICTVPTGWLGGDWASTCTPDRTATNTSDYGQTRSFTQDPQTKTMFAATISGYLLRVKQAGNGNGLSVTTLPAINIGLDQLVDRTTHYVGVRKGVIDEATRALYVPVVQVANPADCPTWPGSAPCTPEPLDQWLYRFDLNTLAQ